LVDFFEMTERSLGERQRILGAEHPDTLALMNNIALTYWAQGRTGEAAELQEEVLAKLRRILGAKYPCTLRYINNLTVIYQAQDRMMEAAALQEEVVETRRRILGPEHPDTLMSIHVLGSWGRASWNPETLTSLNNLACTYWSQGRMLNCRQDLRIGSYRNCGIYSAGPRLNNNTSVKPLAAIRD
jgi:tetratricopeptide (TPR) repeat protein